MLITLTTDFGTQDPFVGVMKGVIKGIAPQVEIIDLTHAIPPQDILAGAFVLKTACRFFPTDTIHLIVIDPGVGSSRRPIAARLGEWLFVGPDNGVLSYVLAEAPLHQAVTLDNPAYHRHPTSRTFHGRDIFAPAAAHLARRVPMSALGTPLETLTALPLPGPEIVGDMVRCHVIHSDIYGNAFTDLTEPAYTQWAVGEVTITVNGQIVPGPLDAYSDVAEGAPLALFGSSGHLEIAVHNGSAREKLGLTRGDAVTLHRRSA